MFENLRRGRQARNFTTNVPKILDKSRPSFLNWVRLDRPRLKKLCLDSIINHHVQGEPQPVRVKDGMSLRNGMWHGSRNDIIMRNVKYRNFRKEINLTERHASKRKHWSPVKYSEGWPKQVLARLIFCFFKILSAPKVLLLRSRITLRYYLDFVTVILTASSLQTYVVTRSVTEQAVTQSRRHG